MAYKHGIYTENIATAGSLAVKATGTVPVYIGTAPIHQTASTENKVNVPILINSYSDFVTKMGESDDWDKYTLCEVAYAHFKNNIQAIAPFIVINMYDPTKHNNEGAGIDLMKITKTEFEAAVKAIDTAAIKCGVTPNIVVAPYFTETKEYAAILVNKCEGLIGGKLGCVAYIDIPTSNDTIAKAISAKTFLSVNSKFAKLHYPKAKHGDKVLHLSVIDAVITQIVDNGTDGVACRSSSNKVIPCDIPVWGANNTEAIYSEADANSLNENGITTINYIGGAYRLWGGQMANYDYSSISSIDGKDRSDATVRMQIYLDNWLKSNFIDYIDAPLTRREIDNLLSRVNVGLNSLVNSGYLLKGECYFDDGDNATAELADGNLVLDVLHTVTPNGKSISFKLQYDSNGLETLYSAKEV